MDATEAKEEDAAVDGCGNEMSIWASRRRRRPRKGGRGEPKEGGAAAIVLPDIQCRRRD